MPSGSKGSKSRFRSLTTQLPTQNNEGLSGDPEGVYQGKFRYESSDTASQNPQEKTPHNLYSISIEASPRREEIENTSSREFGKT